MNIKKSKILLTGGHGFLGKYVFSELISNGVSREHIQVPSSKEFDLRNLAACKTVVRDVDLVIHLAGNVGGIGYNQNFPGTLFYDNAIMGIQLMEEARKSGVNKFVSIGTVCSYPKFTPSPFTERELWNGYPEETNAPYGLAKKMLLVQAQAYRQQYGFNSIYLIPVNLYGPWDNFDDESSHVIPALIRKFLNAKHFKEKEVVVWGTGTAPREFLYVQDAARAIINASERYDASEPVNIGSNTEISISDLAKMIAAVIGFNGAIHFDNSKPDGQPVRKVDTSKAKKYFGFESSTDFKTGLKKTIDWYITSNEK